MLYLLRSMVGLRTQSIYMDRAPRIRRYTIESSHSDHHGGKLAYLGRLGIPDLRRATCLRILSEAAIDSVSVPLELPRASGILTSGLPGFSDSLLVAGRSSGLAAL